MIRELDVVTLTHDIPDHGLSKNTQGAVVHCYADGQGFEVEFIDTIGESTAVLTLESSDIQLEQEIIRARVLEILSTLPADLVAEVRDFAEFLQQRQHQKAS
ncbi:hypothetical protein XM38_023910 [Halomicronema hongdechloris C2206]|uniref:DUF2281 domain-containing protein n=1 Tax=Halomicronema hongdechloris C2206 TaxID=1641165 RepID=A0A1Z3HMA3_9CYAN|nr:DUF4926 domain-containing protein [Halomicronema hongdechloris]ASC71439.1 hypothetical protein XM38_023910 [Halomicronema hongdechloris C2206]